MIDGDEGKSAQPVTIDHLAAQEARAAPGPYRIPVLRMIASDLSVVLAYLS